MQRDYIQREINRAAQVLLLVLGLIKKGKLDDALQCLRVEVGNLQANDFEAQSDLAKLWQLQGDLSDDKEEQQIAYQNARDLYQNLVEKAPFYDLNWATNIQNLQSKIEHL